MIDYAAFLHRIIFKSNTEEEENNLVEDIFKLDREEFFAFLKSIAVLVVTQQQEIKKLESQLAQLSGGLPDSSS